MEVLSKYTLAEYCISAGVADFPPWMYGVEMRRIDEGKSVPMKPWPHQVGDLTFLVSHERAGLFNDAGVGKTVPMQAFASLMAGWGNKVVITMPPKLLEQFAESFLDTYEDISEYLSIFLLEEKQKEAEQIVDGWLSGGGAPDIVLMSYDMFAFLQPMKPAKEKVVTNSATGKSYTRPAVKAKRHHPLKELGYNTLIFDEAHKIKSPSSASHKRVWRWVQSSSGKYQLVLATGTPVYNVLLDAYGLIRILTPHVYSSQKHFERIHAVRDYSNDYRPIIGWKDEETLHKHLYLSARRVTKEEALPWLPEMIPHEHRVTLTPAHKALYKKLMTERVLELEDEFIDATHQSKLRQVALQLISDPNRYSDKPIKNAMDDWLDELLESINVMQHKVIVLAYYKTTIASLAERYAHLNPAVINGSAGSSDADRVKFINDPTCRVLFLNWKSGGAGLNLQHTSYEIFYEVPTVPGDIEQAIARVRRGGQKHAQNIHIPRIMSTIANKSLNQLLSKQMKKNEVVQDKHQMLAELLGKVK